jgi:class 3 adenylate cyclase/tetratricopeptide (TPR) repeat protein
MPICPSCGQDNPEGFRLCGMCGASLAPTEPSRGAERKVVSVVFCDLVGFTARAETLDPEDVNALLGPYHERARHELERHGGTVEKFIGDAVMAVFGAPVAHEDDPERAVRAALAIREFATEQGLELRIGVTTGEALVRLDSRPEAGEGMATGDVVNTGARLQSAAPVNGILVDETTYRATRFIVDYREAAPVEAKGKSEPVAVWEAVAARSRFGVDVTHHARSEFVGRERELSVLRDALERARQERAPQLVTLVAVPGMGKSRLVYELSRIVDADPELITWRQGRCLAYGEGVAFWALAEIVKAQVGILERDGEAETAAKLQAAVADAISNADDTRWVESHLRPLVGLESQTGLGGDRRSEAFAAWRRFLEALAEQGPTVLVLEDLHWADEGLLDFVDELVDWVSGVPLLVVCSARPELLERRPTWGGGKLNASTLALSPLTSEQTALLIARTVEQSVLPAEIQQMLLERAAGNPLYAEQFTQLFLERGSAQDLPLPETLQGIVAARLDGLSPDEKSLLQDAAVIGKVFWSGALRRNEQEVAALLHGLERKGFLTRQRRSSVEQEGEWAFAHMLLRDVAYGQIPRADRSRKHRQTAEWIESLGRPDDHAELLAHHWSSALELAGAAGLETGELVSPARRALRKAGDRAFAVNAYPSAAEHYAHALALCPEEDDERPRLLARHAEALFIAADDDALEALEQARDALLAAGDAAAAAECEVSLYRLWWHRGRSDEAGPHLVHAWALVKDDPPSAAKARVLIALARNSYLSGESEEGLPLAAEAVAIAEALGLDELRMRALANLASNKGILGDASAVADLEQALEVALAIRSPFAATIANNLGVEAYLRLDLCRVDENFQEAQRIALRLGAAENVRWLRGQRISSRHWLGLWDDLLPDADAFIAECEAGSPHYQEAAVRRVRAVIRWARSDAEGALADMRQSLAAARRTKDPQELVPALCTGAELLFERGVDDEARDAARELIETVRSAPEWGVPSLCWDFVFSRFVDSYRAELLDAARGAPESPWKTLAFACLDRDFVRAAEIWAEAGSPTMEARLRLRAGEELIEAGRRAEGEAELATALAFYHTVEATYFVRRGEALLEPQAQSGSV